MLFRPHFWRVRFFLAVALKKFKKKFQSCRGDLSSRQYRLVIKTLIDIGIFLTNFSLYADFLLYPYISLSKDKFRSGSPLNYCFLSVKLPKTYNSG
ncbi:hypothetical protein EAM_0570 [Erwinia amylovora ATCC 49946]|nr:hypothetical protein EAM_0570 [Erwinia amylovora ATCC 49946]